MTATAVGSSFVALTWGDTNANETGCRVEFKTSGASSWSVYQTTDANVKALTVNGLACATKCDFRVKAVGGGNYLDSPCSATASATTEDGTKTLAAPTNLRVEAVGSSYVDLTWSDTNADETGCRVEYKKSGAASWTVYETTAANAKLSFIEV